jgi:pSer/pThr/pTyr-binding forkhead associated (FHA) protein
VKGVPEAVVFLLRVVVLVLLWGFVAAAIVAVRHDVFGTRTARAGVASARPTSTPAPPAKRGRRSQKTPTTLVVTGGSRPPRTVALTELPITIGRAADATIVVDDDYTSSRHARIDPAPGGWVLQDTGSTNGTFVDGTRLTRPAPLRVGTTITVGRAAIEVRG